MIQFFRRYTAEQEETARLAAEEQLRRTYANREWYRKLKARAKRAIAPIDPFVAEEEIPEHVDRNWLYFAHRLTMDDAGISAAWVNELADARRAARAA